MTQYTIHLNDVLDLRKYAALLEQIPFTGYAVSDRFVLSADDILLLFPQCPLPSLSLLVRSELPERQADIRHYLEKSGLLVS